MRSRAYYNEFDPYAAAWLRNLIAEGLIADGEVDERSIADVAPGDLAGFTQCHFFAGIGGWSYALRLAGWPDDRPVWTGSCPCQPFSVAGKRKGFDDERHLWPVWAGLIAERRPSVIFGEQVAQAADWLDGVGSDMAAMGYAFGAAVLSPLMVAKDHARPRLYFVGHSDCDGKPVGTVDAEAPRLPRDRGLPGALARADGVSARVGRLRAYGNAIVPQVAAEFIGAYLDCRA